MKRRAFARFVKTDERGVTAVEFGLIAPALMLLFMGVVEMGLMAGAQNVLDSAAFSASRVGKVGFVSSGSTQQQMVTAAVNKSVATYLDKSKITVTSVSYDDYNSIGQPEAFVDANSNGKYDSGESFTDSNGNGKWDSDKGKSGYGESGKIVVYTIAYDWRFFTPMIGKFFSSTNVIQLKSRLVVRNEPY